LKYLLSHGKVNPNATDRRTAGWNPVHMLCAWYRGENLIDLLKLFVRNGADVNAKTEYQATPLHVLSQYYKNDNLIDLVKFLIQNGVDVNAKDVDGRTALHLLRTYYKNDNLIVLIEPLLKNGADVNPVEPYVKNITTENRNSSLLLQRRKAFYDMVRETGSIFHGLHDYEDE